MDKIPLLNPIIFKKKHIENHADELLKDENISQFFIHSFEDKDVELKLPLPPHKKTVNDFVFVSHGSMNRNLGIDSFQLKKNDFLFTTKNSITTTAFVSKDLRGYYCHFSDEFIGANPFIGNLQTQTSNQSLLQISQENVQNLEFLLARILHLYKNQKSESNNYKLISYYLSTLIAELFLMSENKDSIQKQKQDLSNEFKNMVHLYFKQNLNIQAYASKLNITPNHLNKRVKNETGKTASEIIKEITTLEAKVLLLQSKMTIKEISSELGIDDASYFSRLFKNETNYSPTQYRKMIDLS